MTTSFKVAILGGDFDFSTGTAQTFKIALYDSSATLSVATTAYSTTDEVTGTAYTAGGAALTVSQVPTSSGTTAYLSFSSVTWSASTITARGALIYKEDGVTDPSVAIIDFGSDRSTTAQDFVISFPTANASEAIVRVA
tara:strand:+ start:13495 stop:13911 length:417 start_codon:yes stop_codon:yes gene_type:complete